MKKVKFLIVAMSIFAVMSCERNGNFGNVSVSNPNVPSGVGNTQTPTATTNYTSEDVSAMVADFKNGRFRDIAANQVPDAVTAGFARDFQNVRDVEWEVGVTHSNVYEVEFEANGRDYTAYYDSEGNLLMYIIELWWNEMPQTVKEAVSARYTGYRVDDVDMITVGNTVIYQVDVEKGNSELFAHFAADGTFISEGIDY